jgi:hypothetical protein
VNTKNIYPIGYPSINVQVLIAISLKVLLPRDMGLCKSYSCKERKSIEKDGQVSEISKTMGTPIPV